VTKQDPALLRETVARLVNEVQAMTDAGMHPSLYLYGDSIADGLEALGGERDYQYSSEDKTVTSYVMMVIKGDIEGRIYAFSRRRRVATLAEIQAGRALAEAS
jgi:hypothetical protein